MKIELSGILTTIVIVLAILKMCGLITLHWIWVLAPWWMFVAIVILLFIVIVMFACFWTLIDIIKNFIK